VARAGRDDPAGRFAEGDALGYAGEELAAWGDPRTTLAAVLEQVCDGCEMVTVVAGDGAPLAPGDVEALMPDGVELDLHNGGQPAWWWLIAAE
jgi:hypothetical protein